MKTKPKNWTALVLFLASCIFFSCTSKDDQQDVALATTDSILQADSVKWHRLFEGGDKLTKDFLSRPVDTLFARLCMNGFQRLYRKPTNADLKVLEKAYTWAVSFEGDSLTNWLYNVRALDQGAEIRVCFGVYTKEAMDHPTARTHLNNAQRNSLIAKPRLTVILRAYKNNKPALFPNTAKPLPAYNLGSLKP